MNTRNFLLAIVCSLALIQTKAKQPAHSQYFPSDHPWGKQIYPAVCPNQQPEANGAKTGESENHSDKEFSMEQSGIPRSEKHVVVGAEQLDRLLPLLQDKRTALVVNQTSRVGTTHLLDTLIARGVSVCKVFAPEHGFRGKSDAGETVKNGRDTRTGTPLISLYGHNKKPTPTQLADIDIVVFDIQDVGARFYTYISTLHYVMEACAEQKKPLVVTDRPNPCDYIDGPIRQKQLQSFVSLDPLPILHGCTIGELARMFNGEGWLAGGQKCTLTVIPLQGWKHGQPYSLPVKPSPNLPNDQSIALYPSLCPFEGTAISVGRGTRMPFQILGSPDIRRVLLPNLEGRSDPSKDFQFTPRSLPGFDKKPMYKNQICHGTDLRQVSAPQGFSLKYVIDYYEAYRKAGKADRFFTRPHWFDLLIGNRNVREQILRGVPEETIRAGWQKELQTYRMMRLRYLLYADHTACEPDGLTQETPYHK